MVWCVVVCVCVRCGVKCDVMMYGVVVVVVMWCGL